MKKGDRSERREGGNGRFRSQKTKVRGFDVCGRERRQGGTGSRTEVGVEGTENNDETGELSLSSELGERHTIDHCIERPEARILRAQVVRKGAGNGHTGFVRGQEEETPDPN